jgi:hypothetical protein
MSAAFYQAFWQRVDKSGPAECWPWKGSIRADGYGQFSFDKRRYIASRVALELHTGRPLGGLRACHSCDNPRCVNPAHRFAGTDKDNAQDRERKQRSRSARKTHCDHGHQFSTENTYWFRGKRNCRACNKNSVRKYRSGSQS